MKSSFAAFFALMLIVTVHASMVGWLTSEVCDWQFIQQSGGIRLSAPIERNGQKLLPVDYWTEGNSGLVVRKIELRKRGASLVIRIFTQVVEKKSDTGRIHYAALSGISAGSYEVYYGVAGDPAKRIGHVDIK